MLSFMAPTLQHHLVTEVAEKPTLQKVVRENHSASVERGRIRRDGVKWLNNFQVCQCFMCVREFGIYN